MTIEKRGCRLAATEAKPWPNDCLERGFHVLIYDGRAPDGIEEYVDDPDAAASELTGRILRRFPISEERQSVECDVLLDLRWFDDDDYGRKLLSALAEKPEISVGRIVVWSVVTDRAVRRRFFDQFEVAPDDVLDRGKTDREAVPARFRRARAVPEKEIVRCEENSDLELSGIALSISEMTMGEYEREANKLSHGRMVLFRGDNITDRYVGLESTIALGDEKWEVITVSQPQSSRSIVDSEKVRRLSVQVPRVASRCGFVHSSCELGKDMVAPHAKPTACGDSQPSAPGRKVIPRSGRRSNPSGVSV